MEINSELKQISIADPCHEKWNEMQVSGTSKMCFTCNSEVMDFTDMTSTEIIEYFSSYQNKKTCGRLSKIQLLEIEEKLNSVSISKKGFILTMLVAGMMFTTISCTNRKLTNHYSMPTPINNIEVIAQFNESDTNRISGVLLDEGREPILFANIYLPGTDRGVMTDLNGRFEVNILDLETDTTLVASYVGYSPVEINTCEYLNQEIEITLHADFILLGEVVIVRHPLHKRIWNSILKPFRKKKDLSRI